MHSVVDWFAYAIWQGGVLRRSLSVSPDGSPEDIGTPLPFEEPFRAGQHPVEPLDRERPYPLPYHPLEMAEEGLRALFGFVHEGVPQKEDADTEGIALAGFRLEPKSWASRVSDWFFRR